MTRFAKAISTGHAEWCRRNLQPVTSPHIKFPDEVAKDRFRQRVSVIAKGLAYPASEGAWHALAIFDEEFPK